MGSPKDIDLIGELAQNMLGRTFCPLGDAAAMPTIASCEKFRDEFEGASARTAGLHACAGDAARWWSSSVTEQTMADLINLTIDGRPVKAPAGTLVIDAAKQAGIEIPAFCYYEGFSLQAACRMCLVEVEKMPKLHDRPARCRWPKAWWSAPRRRKVVEARKSMLEFLLTNHPLDCPVCDKGGECELQDMVFRYGAGESRFTEIKHHADEKQWSPGGVLRSRRAASSATAACASATKAWASARSASSTAAWLRRSRPTTATTSSATSAAWCIDICPVGALTSGTYRYQTRPWEMKHVGTICTHCADGCKTTLGVRNGEIMRGNNRDRSGINGEFLCVKGRYAFDFVALRSGCSRR